MDAFFDSVFAANDDFWRWFVIPLLTLVSAGYMFFTRGVQFRLIGQMARGLGESPGLASDGQKATSPFQAFAISASSRVGTGNIVGVSIAIATGGPGAVFWMWAMAMLVAASAFAESALGQLYKVRTPTGYRGGPAYYMKYGLGKAWMGGLFAVILIITYPLIFNMVQANTFTAAVSDSLDSFGANPGDGLNIVIGILLAAMLAMIVFGGLRRIAHVAQTLIPAVAGLYLIVGIVVVAVNIDNLPAALGDVFVSAFGLREVGGAALGTAFMIGVRRGMFSNEAGMGSAPNAGATASVSHPVKQGLTQAFGVYFDTLFICTISAFIILVTNPVYGDGSSAGNLVARGLEASMGSWALHLLTVILMLCTFTSLIGNYYYGESNMAYLSSHPIAVNVLRLAVVAGAFLGSVASLDVVWGLADVSMGIMATVNLIAIALLGGVTVKLLADYDKQRRAGLDPVFTADRLPGLRGVQVWETPECVKDPVKSKV